MGEIKISLKNEHLSNDLNQLRSAFLLKKNPQNILDALSCVTTENYNLGELIAYYENESICYAYIDLLGALLNLDNGKYAERFISILDNKNNYGESFGKLIAKRKDTLTLRRYLCLFQHLLILNGGKFAEQVFNMLSHVDCDGKSFSHTIVNSQDLVKQYINFFESILNINNGKYAERVCSVILDYESFYQRNFIDLMDRNKGPIIFKLYVNLLDNILNIGNGKHVEEICKMLNKKQFIEQICMMLAKIKILDKNQFGEQYFKTFILSKEIKDEYEAACQRYFKLLDKILSQDSKNFAEQVCNMLNKTSYYMSIGKIISYHKGDITCKLYFGLLDKILNTNNEKHVARVFEMLNYEGFYCGIDSHVSHTIAINQSAAICQIYLKLLGKIFYSDKEEYAAQIFRIFNNKNSDDLKLEDAITKYQDTATCELYADLANRVSACSAREPKRALKYEI